MSNLTHFLILGFALVIIPMASGSTESAAMARKFYPRFVTSESLDGADAVYDFKNEVPSSMKAYVLADIIEMHEEDSKKEGMACALALYYLDLYPDGKNVVWNKRLKDAILLLKNSPNPNLRRSVLSLAANVAADQLPGALKPPGVFYSFLRDVDEDVRVKSLLELSKLPTGKKDLQAYITANKASDKGGAYLVVADRADEGQHEG